jgi:hypothetical protein
VQALLRAQERFDDAAFVHGPVSLSCLLQGQLDLVGDADVADMAAGAGERIACIIDSWVPTASMRRARRARR